MSEPLIKTYSIFRPYDHLVHGFSTRRGGVSRMPYDSLNLGLSTPDDQEAVKENRRLFFKALGISENQVVFPQQVHSDNVQIVNEPGVVPNCDALITDRTALYLSIQTADCFPVFLYDSQRKVVAIIHSGWRGTAKNIVGKTIRLLKKHFSTRPGNIFALIGPGVQKACYQVDLNVASYFNPEFYVKDGAKHFRLDLQGSIRQQLLQAGVPLEQIEEDHDCTHCRKDLYYSYRRDGRQSGRMMGIIGLRA